MHKKLSQRPGALKVLDNISWLLLDKVVRLGMGLLVGVWLARYLGPQGFGSLNFATALVALFAACAALGLNGIVVRNLVRQPEEATVLLGSAFCLHLCAALLSLLALVAGVAWLQPDNALLRELVLIIGLGQLFHSSAVVKYWFEAQIASRYSVWAENGAFLLCAALKAIAIVSGMSLLVFAWIILLEAALTALALFVLYQRQTGCLFNWRPQLQRAGLLLQQSWPLALSALSIIIYMKIDQIMLGQILGEKAVGIYSAAVRISEVWYFVPLSIAASMFPSILAARQQDALHYQRRLQQLYDAMATLALVVALGMSVLAGPVVNLLFGAAYMDAVPALQISIWTGLSVAMSAVHGKWLLAEGLQKLGLVYTTAGALINVGLNLLLIPRYGITGAAWATVCAQTAPVFLQAFIPAARPNLYMMLKALFAPVRYPLSRWL